MHRIGLEQRSGLKITGVINIGSFDEHAVYMDTEEGTLGIKGKGLNVSRLTLEKGEVDIDGRVDSLIYLDKKQKNRKNDNVFKLFR